MCAREAEAPSPAAVLAGRGANNVVIVRVLVAATAALRHPLPSHTALEYRSSTHKVINLARAQGWGMTSLSSAPSPSRLPRPLRHPSSSHTAAQPSPWTQQPGSARQRCCPRPRPHSRQAIIGPLSSSSSIYTGGGARRQGTRGLGTMG